MISVYMNREGQWSCQTLAEGSRIPASTVWIDLFSPTQEEKELINKALGLELPTREEMLEIEVSSRLYQESGAFFMTAPLLFLMPQRELNSTVTTFVLTNSTLITIRYADTRLVTAFTSRLLRQVNTTMSHLELFFSLLDSIVDHMADILEMQGAQVEAISVKVFATNGQPNKINLDLQEIIRQIGREGDHASKIRESLVGFSRLISYLHQATTSLQDTGQGLRDRIKILGRDVTSLSDHATFLSSKITFLLDATLGIINIEQNNIIKIFSVAAVALMPPTLIASIYGMNFHFLPELEWTYGYPTALLAMVISGCLPYLYFKRKGWL